MKAGAVRGKPTVPRSCRGYQLPPGDDRDGLWQQLGADLTWQVAEKVFRDVILSEAKNLPFKRTKLLARSFFAFGSSG